MRIAFLFASITVQATAHELQENRATLVLRDQGHVSVTMYLNYAELLYQAIAPQRPYAAFLVVYSGMKPEDLRKELATAQSKFQSSTRMQLAGGGEAALSNWQWPDVKQVQELLRRQLAQAIVGPANHAHEQPSEIRVEATAPKFTAVYMRFPAEFQRVLVVSYRPNQTWVDPKAAPPEIKF